jgi:hypothetical protein
MQSECSLSAGSVQSECRVSAGSVLRKGCERFRHRPLVPSRLGEWQCEELFSSARDPGCQRTGNFSAHEFMCKINRLLHTQNEEHDNPLWIKRDRVCVHDASLYMLKLDAQEMHEAMVMGSQMWEDVALVHGYGGVYHRFPTLPLQYAQLLKLSKLQLAEGVSWEAWHDYILQQANVEEVSRVEAAAAAPDFVRQRYAQELDGFMAACNAVKQCTKHEVGVEAEPGLDVLGGSVVGASSSSGNAMSWQEANHITAHVFNGQVRRQCRDLLGRYRDQLRGAPSSFVRQLGCEELLVVGCTYAFLFEVLGELCLYVGRMRAVVAAAMSSTRNQMYLGVSRDDATAQYFCHPYARVLCSSSEEVTLEVPAHEKHQWWKLVRTTTRHAAERDSDSEYEDGGDDGHSKRGCDVSNVLEEVKGVVWHADGASVTPPAAQQLSLLLDKYKCSKGTKKRAHHGRRKGVRLGGA